MLKFPPVPNPYAYARDTAPRDHIIVACVNVGPKYPPSLLQRLKQMVDRHLTVPHDFFCVTDRPDAYELPIITVLPERTLDGWWSKFNLFMPGTFPEGERILYLDLDVVITDSIDCFAEATDEFIMIENYSPNKSHSAYNSSIMAWTAGGIATEVISAGWRDEYSSQTHGDQEVIWMLMDQHIRAWPVEWAPSYKYHCRGRGLAPGSRIVVFHGDPKPSEVRDGWVVANYLNVP